MGVKMIAIVIAMGQMGMDLTRMAMVMEMGMVTRLTSMQHQKLLLSVGQMETKMEEIMDLMIVTVATVPMEMDQMDQMDQMETDPILQTMDCAARSHVKSVSQ